MFIYRIYIYICIYIYNVYINLWSKLSVHPSSTPAADLWPFCVHAALQGLQGARQVHPAGRASHHRVGPGHRYSTHLYWTFVSFMIFYEISCKDM